MSITTDTGSSPIFMGAGDGMGGSAWIWAFLIMIMFGFGGFGGFGGGNGRPATQDFVQAQANYSNLLDQNRDISTLITNGTAQNVAATNQVYHDIVNNLGDKYSELARDIAGVNTGVVQAIANQNQCCCSTKMVLADGFAQTNANLAQNRYDAALNTAAINANVTAQTQKILDTLAQNKIEALQGKVNQLELSQAMTGVVKYPQSMTYGAGPSPFCNCGGGYPFYG